ncbi:MAG: DUF2807 domain-containing protein [Saonia sp.]
MKKLFLVSCLLFYAFSFSQKQVAINEFETMESTIGATFVVVRSMDYRLEFSGDTDKVDFVQWEVSDEILEINATQIDTDFSHLTITVYTPAISAVSIRDSGILTMDDNFSKIEYFVAYALDSATVDLSNIDFKNLSANATDGGKILYKSTRNLVSSTDGGGMIRRAEVLN